MRNLILIAALSLHASTSHAQTSYVPDLTTNERSAISSALSKAEKDSVTIVCGGPWCRQASDDLASLFFIAGWKVDRINHGGLGIDGLTGIRVVSCRGKSAGIHHLLKSATQRKIEVVDDTNCWGHEAIYIVIGTPEN
jgi:hypothetical protein